MTTNQEAKQVFNEDLFGKEIETPQDSYITIGSVFEELTRELFGGIIETLTVRSSEATNPDLQEKVNREFFVECKAAKNIYGKGSLGGRAEWKLKETQIQNYQSFLDSYTTGLEINSFNKDPALLYAFWVYDIGKTKIGDFENSGELILKILESNLELHIIDSHILKNICDIKPLSSPASFQSHHRIRRADFRLLDRDNLGQFCLKWEIPVNKTAYFSSSVSNLKACGFEIKKFPIRVLLDKSSYNKESINKFLKEMEN